MTAAGADPERKRRELLPHWTVVLVGGVAILLIPWAFALGEILPSRHAVRHWDIAWTGFDLALGSGLLATAFAAHRGSAWLQRIATAAGTLLLCDAWFDLLTASSRTEQIVAVVEAAVAEVPLAVLCFVIATNPELLAQWSPLRRRGRGKSLSLR